MRESDMGIRGSRQDSADILVCVHNSIDDVRACLDSVVRTMGPKDRLIIVDDGSHSPTQALCEEVAARLGTTKCLLIRHEEAKGFSKAANAGAKQSRQDICIFLNSDTIVNGDWIDRLSACMEQQSDIGLAGPLSNSGGWQSIPLLPKYGKNIFSVSNNLNHIANIDNYCFKHKFDGLILVEQLNGFCLTVKQEVFATIGYFDEAAFPRGYGEESDFLLRALGAGFKAAVASDCFVYHAKTKSYGASERKRLVKLGRVELDRKHGADRVQSAVLQARSHPALQKIRRRAFRDFILRGWIFK